MVYIRNQQRSIKVNQQRIRSLLNKALHLLGLHRAELSILLVNNRRMKILNRQFLGVDKTTDVLSFTQLSAKEMKSVKAEAKTSKPQNFRTSEILLGDIVINLQKAKKQAEEHGLTLNEELKKLMIHGLLHLIGYDHEKNRYQRNKMESKERELFDVLR